MGSSFTARRFVSRISNRPHGANWEVLEQSGKNRLTVTRQVPYHPGDNHTLDMVLAVNGLPVATIELKNPGTGQNWRHAMRQYKKDRDSRAPLFEFKKRALVHFAADLNDVHMITRVAGEKTHFLPFNRGSHPGQIICGAGNPQHESGYRTAYLHSAGNSRLDRSEPSLQSRPFSHCYELKKLKGCWQDAGKRLQRNSRLLIAGHARRAASAASCVNIKNRPLSGPRFSGPFFPI